jgi:hypothetical protein
MIKYRGTLCFRNSKKIRKWVQAQGVTLLNRESVEVTSSGTRIAKWTCEMNQLAYNNISAKWQEFDWSLEVEDE